MSNERLYRWYRGFSANGNARVVSNKLVSLLDNQSEEMRRHVSGVRCEAANSGNFYFFVGVSSPQLKVSTESLEELFDKIQQANLGYPLPSDEGCFQLEDISKMTSHEVVYKPFGGTQITAIDIATPPIDNPLDDRHPEPIGPPPTAQYPNPFDRLLIYLSAKGSGNWQQFKDACTLLTQAEASQHHRSILRRLKLLGHLETSSDGKQWSINPSRLIQTGLTDGSFQFLAGAREGKQGGQATANRMAPSRLEVEASNAPVITNPASEIAVKLPSNLRQLYEEVDFEPSAYRANASDGSSYSSYSDSLTQGLYQFTHLRDENMKYSLLYSQGKYFRGDYYGLRFWSHQLTGSLGPVVYHSQYQQLMILEEQRWPEVFERTLVLASGLLPQKRDTYLIYQNINLDLIGVLSEKLNLGVSKHV